MQYEEGRLGRIFVVRFEHKDDVAASLERFARQTALKSGVVVFLGAFHKGKLVAGPKKAVIPPEAHQVPFSDGWEVFGVGTIFTGRSGPQIHIHAGMGKKTRTIVGCVRKNVEVFLVIEAVVFELKGVKARKEIDPKTGLNLLMIRPLKAGRQKAHAASLGKAGASRRTAHRPIRRS